MNENSSIPSVRQDCRPVPCGARVEGDAAQAITMAKRYIDENYCESINLDDLAEHVGMTRFSLAKQFRQRFGVAPYRYVCLVRVRQAQAMMQQGQRPTEIASEVGFFDQSHLARHFKRLCGMTPRQYRTHCMLAASQ
jgi:AraC-like DNA-binding protein